jgi:hypothetical protein
MVLLVDDNAHGRDDNNNGVPPGLLRHGRTPRPTPPSTTHLTGRNRLLALSQSLPRNSPTGRFLSRPADTIGAIRELEAI